MPTATETNDIEALLTIITREDLEGEIAQLRAAVNVLAKNPKPSIAENAKALIESLTRKVKNVNAHAVLAHKTLDEFEKNAQAKARASLAAEINKWSAYADHLKDQLTTCNRELERARSGQTKARSPSQQPQTPRATHQQQLAISQIIHKAWPTLKDVIYSLLRIQQPINLQMVRQAIQLERSGIPFEFHDIIYQKTYKALLDAREKIRAAGPDVGFYDHIYNVYRAMMEAV